MKLNLWRISIATGAKTPEYVAQSATTRVISSHHVLQAVECTCTTWELVPVSLVFCAQCIYEWEDIFASTSIEITLLIV